VSRSTVPIRLQSLQNLDNSSFGFFIPVSSNSSDWTPVARTSRRVQNMHTIKEKRSEISKWKVCSPFPHGSTSGGSAQKAPVFANCSWYTFSSFRWVLLRTTTPHCANHKGAGKKAVKQKMQGISIVRSRAGCLVPVGELDTLLNGRLELALEVFQPLLLKVVELTQTKHFLHSILAEPYL